MRTHSFIGRSPVVCVWPLILLGLLWFGAGSAPTALAVQPAETADAETNAETDSAETADSAPAETEPAETEPAETGGDEPEPEPEADGDAEQEAEAEAEEEAEAAPPAGDDADAPAEGGDGEGDGAQDGDPVAEEGINPYITLMVIASLIVPVIVGNWLGKKIGMPDHGWKIATILLTLSAAGMAILLGSFTLGPDLAGGTTLIYELKNPEDLIEKGEEGEQQENKAEGGRKKVTAQEMCDAIKQRVDPSGTKEVTIRPIGNAIEVIIPRASQEDKEYIKKMIIDLGQLEFRIVADPQWDDDSNLIKAAMLAPPTQKMVSAGQDEGRWVRFNEKEFGAEGDGLVIRQTGKGPEALVKIDLYEVTGEYLTDSKKGFGDEGAEVQFSFNSKGAARFLRLTRENLPQNNRQRRLGILLNNELFSAPGIRSEISRNGQISGRNMSEQDVDYVVSILNAGSLPAALNETPLSEATTSPTLGAETIAKAKIAIGVSLAAVLIFMALYYRFAGLVACLALAANLLLVLGLMVMMDAAFTLPGLAGLVLTVGMSVDANVLIFERIREEMNRGAALRMAIRNGFGRATTTIVDANVTTLIAGVVLYYVGKDNIKGFAVTLVLGIVVSMYTAIFCSRVLFDIAERRRWISTLHFSSIVRKTNLNFIGKRQVAMVFSIVLIGFGLAAVAGRGSKILNIDFTGGTSVNMVLKSEDAMPFKEVDALLRDTELVDKDLLVVQQQDAAAVARGEEVADTRYRVNSNLAAGLTKEELAGRDLVQETQDIIAEAFEGKLLSYSVQLGEATPTEEGTTGSKLTLSFNEGEDYADGDGLAHDALADRIQQILDAKGHNTTPLLEAPGYKEGSSQRYKEWTLTLGGLSPDEATQVVNELKQDLEARPIFPLASVIGGKVAGNMRWLALQAILLSLVGIVAYVWFRFQNVSFGLAAVVALVHDVLVTLGAIAASAYLVQGAGSLADLFQIEAFQISLPILAAFLTIIGYSLNDTIVVFDRIREVRGKSPTLTADMINTSINQTLSRTLLTSLTTLLVVGILYFFGGPGIHGFAFALVVGVIVGTYSSIFIASPALLALIGGQSGPESAKKVEKKPDAA